MSLHEITIGSGVTEIGDSAFFINEIPPQSANRMVFMPQTVNCAPIVPPNVGTDGFYKPETSQLHVLPECADTYRAAAIWCNFGQIIPDYSGIEDIIIDTSDNETPITIYNLKGQAISTSTEDLKTGIYLLRRGRKVIKIAVK